MAGTINTCIIDLHTDSIHPGDSLPPPVCKWENEARLRAIDRLGMK